MTKAYVVLENTWEYNDEYYFTPEGGGGTPQKVFFKKEDAEKLCTELTLNALKSKYTHDMFIEEDGWSRELSQSAIKFLEENGLSLDDWECFIIPDHLFDELAPKLEGFVYSVYEVDAEGNLK